MILLNIFLYSISIVFINIGIRSIITFISLKSSKLKQSTSYYINIKSIIIEFFVLLIPTSFLIYLLLVIQKYTLPDLIIISIATILASLFSTYSFIIQPIMELIRNDLYAYDVNIQNEIKKITSYDVTVRIINSNVYNAYATGILPSSKMILIGRPLYEELSTIEILGIALHELGHLHFKHLLKQYYANIVSTFLFVISMFYLFPIVKTLLLIDEGLLIAFFAVVVGGILRIIPTIMQRKFEYQSDKYAADIIGKEQYISALNKVNMICKGALEEGTITHPKLNNRIKNVFKK
jgi:Zn-dependent protease with chaperone function